MPDYGYRTIPENQWLDLLDEIKELKAQLETAQQGQQTAQIREKTLEDRIKELEDANDWLQPRGTILMGKDDLDRYVETKTAPLHNEIIHLQTQLRQAQEAVEAARETALMEAAKAVCNYCKEDSEGGDNREMRLNRDGTYVHGSDPRNDPSDDYYGAYDDCKADAIRQLMAAGRESK